VTEQANKLTLPEEFVLLLHKPNGSYYATADQTAAAEIGELVLQHRIKLDGTKLLVLDPRPSGIAWIDELLSEFQKKSGVTNKPVELTWWLPMRTGAFKAHRAALTEHGLLTHKSKKTLGFIPSDRYYADDLVRDALVSEIRQVARVERPIDNRLALLCALVHRSGLVNMLGFDNAERAMLKSIAEGENLGDAVESAIVATTVAITTIPVFIATTGTQ
jgi:hypothetical protein